MHYQCSCLGRNLTSGLHYFIILSYYPFIISTLFWNLFAVSCISVSVTSFSLFWIYTCTAKMNELCSNLLNGQFFSRLLLTCLSQPEVANVWVERIRENPSVYDCVCFIMSSSTNGKLPKQAGSQWVFAEKKKRTQVCNFKDKYFQLGVQNFFKVK